MQDAIVDSLGNNDLKRLENAADERFGGRSDPLRSAAVLEARSEKGSDRPMDETLNEHVDASNRAYNRV